MEVIRKKVCASCKKEKEITEFSKDKHQKDGYTYSCKECRNKRYNEWARNNRDIVNKRNAEKWEARRDYYKSERGVESSRRTHLKRMFGITLEEYNEILEKQNKVCAVCEKPETSQRLSFLSVDHCHKTNKIRGLLCNNCNRAIGLLKEDIETLEKAINYLKKEKLSYEPIITHRRL